MTEPLKLAEETEGMDQYGSRAADRRLIAAALRLAEAGFALDAHEELEPHPDSPDGRHRQWSDVRYHLLRAVEYADAEYAKAREGK